MSMLSRQCQQTWPVFNGSSSTPARVPFPSRNQQERRVQPQRSLKPSLAIACSFQRKPTLLSFVRDCSAWPAIGCGRPWKWTTRRHQLIALCGAGGFSPHAARLERARELVLCGTQIDLLRAGWADASISFAFGKGRCEPPQPKTPLSQWLSGVAILRLWSNQDSGSAVEARGSESTGWRVGRVYSRAAG
jgi:hypothetical protein